MSHPIRYLSVCSGIEAASVAWRPLGWQAVGFSEVAKFPSAVLKHRFPDVPNFGDMTQYSHWNIDGPVDLVCGGTPCQSFSLAGLRGGLDDDRGVLALVFLRLVDFYRPRWVVWENVGGVLSSNDGRDFGAFLGGLAELGYGWAYRVLDAQYFGVPQRRRRVFVVGYLGDWRPTAAVLLEPESLRGGPPPSREERPKIAPDLSPRLRGQSQTNHSPNLDAYVVNALCSNGKAAASATLQQAESGHLLAFGGDNTSGAIDVAPCLNAGRQSRQDFGTECMIAFFCKDHGADAGEIAPTLRAMNHAGSHANAGGQVALAFPAEMSSTQMGARRLTPKECERLQGFPDDWTKIPWRGRSTEDCPDGPRYQVIGNSWAVPVANRIGRRIQLFETATASLMEA